MSQSLPLSVCPPPQLDVTQSGTLTNPTDIKPEEYFNEMIPLEGRDIGRPREVTTKVQKFRATLWLSENHPLSLQEQVLPIIDLMAISNAHFAKLRDFITLQLPAGFPVKIGKGFGLLFADSIAYSIAICIQFQFNVDSLYR